MRFRWPWSRKPKPPQYPARRNGFNAAFAANYAGITGFVPLLRELGACSPGFVLRFPGGTLANYTHTSGRGYGLVHSEIANAPQSIAEQFAKDQSTTANHLDTMVALAKDSGAAVLWVANLYTGRLIETVEAIGAFKAAGVEVVGVELGNEWYLTRYRDKYRDVYDYATQAKAWSDEIKRNWPDMPVGVIVAPSAGMKDADSGRGRAKILSAANEVLRDLKWPDAYVLHSYAQAADPAGHRDALRDHLDTFAKPVWITEWNLHGTENGGTATQLMHYGAMMDMLDEAPKVTVQTLHNLAATGDGYNVVRCKVRGAELTRLGEVILERNNTKRNNV